MSPLKTAKHAEQNPHQSTGNHRAAVAQMKTENFRAALAGSKMMVISKTKELEEKAFAFLAMRKQENQIRANARRLYPRGEETARVATTCLCFSTIVRFFDCVTKYLSLLRIQHR